METIHILENAYRALLSLDPAKRLDFQPVLVELRDVIAEITGENSKDVQNKFEPRFVERIDFYGSLVRDEQIGHKHIYP